jgi:large subunit ribosomal protein L25
LRREGKIPAVVYSDGKSTLITLNPSDMRKILNAGSENALINLKITGSKVAPVTIIKDYQRDPVTGDILHADMFEISMNEVIKVKVHVKVSAEIPTSVKEGGVLQHNLREIEIECLPGNIPEHILVDTAELKIGEAVHLRDLIPEEGIKIIGDKDLVVVSIAAPITEAKLEEMLAGAPAAAEAAEPEIAGKKEKEEEPAGGEKAKTKKEETPKGGEGTKGK